MMADAVSGEAVAVEIGAVEIGARDWAQMAEEMRTVLELSAEKSEGLRFTVLLRAKAIFTEMKRRLDPAQRAAEEAEPSLAQIEEVALFAEGMRLWSEAEAFYRLRIERAEERSNGLLLRHGLTLRMLGRLEEAEARLAACTKTFRKSERFLREYRRLQATRERVRLEEMERTFLSEYAAGRHHSAKFLAAWILARRNAPDAVLCALPEVMAPLLAAAAPQGAAGQGAAEAPSAETGSVKTGSVKTGAQDRGASSLRLPDMSAHVFIGGFGWSGSGAVVDYLGQSSEISIPFGHTEASVFDGLPSSRACIAELLRLPETTAPDALQARLLAILYEGFYGLDTFAPNGAKPDYAYSKSLLAPCAADPERAAYFSQVLRQMVAALCPPEGLVGVARAGEVISAGAACLLERLRPASRRALYSNCIHSRNAIAIRHLPGARLISVQRDPRDQFVAIQYERKRKSKMTVERFITMVREGRALIASEVAAHGLAPRVLHLGFEDFVQDPARRRQVCDFLDLDPGLIAEGRSFHPEQSGANIGIYRDYPDQRAIAEITEALM